PVVVADSQWRDEGWKAGPRLRAALSVLRVEELIRTDNAPIMRKHHLTHSRHAALALLYFSRDGQLPMNTLSKRLMVHPTSVTSTVDALEKYGHVGRVTHPNDRRTTLARITDSGRVAIEETCKLIGTIDFSLG